MKTQLNRPNRDQSHSTLRSLLSCWPLLLAALAWVGCNQGGTPAADINPAGTYTLVSVNSNNVPCALDHDGHTLTIKSGAFSINTNGTCASKMSFTTPAGADASREVKAAWTRDAATLTMKWEGAGTTIGAIKGDTFTMNNEGMVLAYRRTAQ